MKMTTEEKAKAYDEAIKVAEGLWNSPRTCFDIDQLTEIFPELRESEDENIREWCISHFRECFHTVAGDNAEYAEFLNNKVIPWLEKQKEQKLAEINEYEIIKKHITEDALSSEVNKRLKECGWYVTDEKPAWSEEDKETLEKLHRLLIICRGEKKFIQEADYNKMDNLLKSLRPKPQNNMSIGFMVYLDEHRPDGKMCLSNAECNEIETAFKNQSWDTILRYVEKYKPHWKPSEEEMKGLKFFLDFHRPQRNAGTTNWREYDAVESLYKQLQKLM